MPSSLRGVAAAAALLGLAACAGPDGPPAQLAQVSAPHPANVVAAQPPPTPPAPEPVPASIPDPVPSASEAASPEPIWQPRSLVIAREALAGEAKRLSDGEREQVARELAEMEQEHGIDVLLVLALITQESRFDPGAIGPRGSVGLMQVRPFVGKDVAARYGIAWDGAGTLFDPVRNVAIGTRYFVEMVGMFDRDDYALAAYNMGPYRLRRLLRRGWELDVLYVDRVYEHYEALIERYGNTATGWGG